MMDKMALAGSLNQAIFSPSFVLWILPSSVAMTPGYCLPLFVVEVMSCYFDKGEGNTPFYGVDSDISFYDVVPEVSLPVAIELRSLENCFRNAVRTTLKITWILQLKYSLTY